MSALVTRFQQHRLNTALLLLLITTAAFVGAVAGYRSSFTLQALFRLLVLTNIVLVAYLVLLRNIVAGLLVYLYSLVFLNYYWRIVIPGIWPDLDIPRIMFSFVWLIFLLEILLGQKRMLPNTSIGTMMLLVLGAITLSMFTNGTPAIRQFLNGYVIPYAMFVICKNIFTERRDVEKFVFWLAIPLALYFPATAILEHYRVTSLLFPRYIGKALIGEVEVNWGGRAMGAFIQPVATGFAMIGVYVLAMYSLSRVRRTAARLYAFLISIITPIGVFFTYTRSVYMGFAAALLILMAFSRRLRLTALVLLVLMALGVIGNWANITTAERTSGGLGDVDTAQARVVIAFVSVNMFMDHPFFGIGFTRFIEKAKPYIGQVRTTFLGYREAWIGEYTNQHNQFLSVLTEIGLVGFAPFLLLYVLMLRTLWKARGTVTNLYDSEFVVAVWAVMVAYLSQLLFIEPRFFEFMNCFPFMMAGIVAGGYQRAAMERAAGGNRCQALQRKEYAT